MRTVIAITGASGSNFAVNFITKCPNEKFLVASKWGKRVVHEELGLKFEELESMVDNTYSDSDLASPFASGSNYFDSLVIVPCSVSTLNKIASGISDTLITRKLMTSKVYSQELIGQTSSNKIHKDVEKSINEILSTYLDHWYRDNPLKQF